MISIELKREKWFGVLCSQIILTWGARTGGAGGAMAPPIFLEIGEIVAFITPDIFRSKEGAAPDSH